MAWILLLVTSLARTVIGLVVLFLRLDSYHKVVGPWERFSRSFGKIKNESNVVDLEGARVLQAYKKAIKEGKTK